MSKVIGSCPSPSPAQGQDPQGSSDRTNTAWNTSHPPLAPHPTRPKGAEEGQRTGRPLGTPGLRRGSGVQGRCTLEEKVQELCSLGSSAPLGLKGLPLGSLTVLTTTRKKGKAIHWQILSPQKLSSHGACGLLLAGQP